MLLKPLEETGEAEFVLVSSGDNLLADTIVSRCVVEILDEAVEEKNDFWTRVLECWKRGPSECISLSDSLSNEEALELAEIVCRKMRDKLGGAVSKKRLEILRSAMDLSEEMRSKNLNVKLCLGKFLLEGWQATRN